MPSILSATDSAATEALAADDPADINMSQYIGERRRYDIDLIEFWKDGQKEAIRKASFIYDPSLSLAQLQEQCESQDKELPPSDEKDSSAINRPKEQQTEWPL